MAADLEHAERAAVAHRTAQGPLVEPAAVPRDFADTGEDAGEGAGGPETGGEHPARWRTAVRTLARRPGLLLAGVFVFLVVLSAPFPGLFTAADPNATDGVHKLE